MKHRHTGIAAILEQSAELLTLVFCLQQPFKSCVKPALTEEKFLILILWMNSFWSVTVLKLTAYLFHLKKEYYVFWINISLLVKEFSTQLLWNRVIILVVVIYIILRQHWLTANMQKFLVSSSSCTCFSA